MQRKGPGTHQQRKATYLGDSLGRDTTPLPDRSDWTSRAQPVVVALHRKGHPDGRGRKKTPRPHVSALLISPTETADALYDKTCANMQ
jgi:hypothetical protein